MLPHQPISIAGTSVATDAAGRYSLNDLHKAAGAEPRHQPARFLANQTAQALIEEISTTEIPVVVVNGGRAPGTYACKELVYAYAMWISAKFHLQVIRTFDAVATGATPAPAPAAPSAVTSAKEFRAIFGIARLIGLDKNAAAISANQGAAALTGTNMLQLMGHTHLVTPTQEICFTPTELGHRRCVNARTFNRSLADAGLQERIGEHWVPTAKGRPHAVVLDTGKSHSSGTPIQQVKWRDSVLSEVAL